MNTIQIIIQLEKIQNIIKNKTKTFQGLSEQCERIEKLIPTLDNKNQVQLQNIQDNLFIELGGNLNQLNELLTRYNDLQEYID